MQIQLIKPLPKHEEQVWKYRAEFLKHNYYLAGAAGLDQHESFASWYKKVCDNAYAETVYPGLVVADTFLVMDCSQDKMIGMVDIRHELNDYLLQFGGHIGYSVRRTERRKGLGTKILARALEHCKAIGINKVLLTCDQNNIASSKIIENNNGILENIVEENGRKICRYWIKVQFQGALAGV